jgi:hypothetical protein
VNNKFLCLKQRGDFRQLVVLLFQDIPGLKVRFNLIFPFMNRQMKQTLLLSLKVLRKLDFKQNDDYELIGVGVFSLQSDSSQPIQTSNNNPPTQTLPH